MLPTTEEEYKQAVTTAIADATKGIRAELSEERAKRSDFERQIKKIQDELETAKKAESDAALAKEKAELESKGKYDEALAKSTDAYTKKLSELQKAIAERDATIQNLMIDGRILGMADDAVNPGQVVTLMKSMYRFEIKDGEVVVQAADGKPMLDAKGKPLSMDDAYTQFMGENPHLVKPGSASGGSGTRSGIPGQTRQSGSIDDQIDKARKAGNRQEVIKLKMKKMSLAGPHALKEENKAIIAK